MNREPTSFEHLDRGVRKPTLQVNHLGDQRRPAAARAIIAQEEGRRYGALPHELPETVFMDRIRQGRPEGDPTDMIEPLQDIVEVAGAGGFRETSEPGERRAAEIGLVAEQGINECHLVRRQRSD